jgi:RNA polymerase sigma-70 factor (ECF subfamily)
MAPIPDSFLIERITHQDTTALSELYDRYGRLVFSIALRILGDAETAEEITQDVFVLVWQKASSFDHAQGKLMTWIASIARNRSIDQLRRVRIRPEGYSIAWEDCCAEDADEQPGIENGVMDNHQRLLLIKSVNALPQDQREALSLAFFYGMTQQEISDKLNQPLGTVKTRIRLGLQKLRAVITSNFLDDA